MAITPDPDHFYTFGDVYEAIETCDQLSRLLGRLQRQGLLSPEDCTGSKERLAEIRQQLEERVNSSALLPKGPRLP